MRKVLLIGIVVVLAAGFIALPISAEKGGKDKDCIKIKDGIITSSTGEVLKPGFDPWGYNYQARMYYGFYSNYTRPTPPVDDDDTMLMMKWNDAWLSNKSCDGDYLLDRHYGFDSYIGSGAWLTNHQWGTYEDSEGNLCNWVYFVKIVAVPADANKVGGYWYSAEGKEIGPVIWGAFAIVQQVYNDTCTGEHGIEYLSPVGPGFGKFKK